ncbi:unnamed protein product, partial [Urochloa humidicola]
AASSSELQPRGLEELGGTSWPSYGERSGGDGAGLRSSGERSGGGGCGPGEPGGGGCVPGERWPRSGAPAPSWPLLPRVDLGLRGRPGAPPLSVLH